MRIYNTDGIGIRRLRQRHALRRLGDDSDPIMRPARRRRPRARDRGRPCCRSTRVSELVFTVDMGPPRFAGTRFPLREPFAGHPRDRRRAGCPRRPSLQSPSAVNMGNPACDLLGRQTPRPTISRASARCSKTIRSFRERANISLAQVTRPIISCCRCGSAAPALTRACGSAACATVVAAARKGLTGRKRHGDAARRRSRHRVARERRPRADDRPGRARARGRASRPPCSPEAA